MRKRLETQQSHNAHISFGSKQEKKKKSPEIQLMGSIRARKLYLIALILACQQLQIPSYSHYPLNVLWLWHVCGLRVELYYLSIIDLLVQKLSSFFLSCAYGPEGKALGHLRVWSFSDEDVSVCLFVFPNNHMCESYLHLWGLRMAGGPHHFRSNAQVTLW